mgnify:CR=1 FL=1
MKDPLLFDEKSCQSRTLTLLGRMISYREYRDIVYCRTPVADIQKMNIFVPEAYYHGQTVNGFDRDSAPVFMPNTVGGYMPGPSDEPGIDTHTGSVNSVFAALEHGYVVVSAGVRGRTTGIKGTEFFEGSKEGSLGQEDGRKVGRAPALIVDYKAAVRYLRHNRKILPGNMDHIITNGTSAGGALSALAGSTGNSTAYEPYLRAIGAAEEEDNVFAASCYCPIHNLDHADMAYEWQFCGLNDFHRTRHQRTDNGIIRVLFEGEMTAEQIRVSQELKKLFPAYLNSLDLSEGTGRLTLDENGEGPFKEYVKKYVVESADREYHDHNTQKNISNLMVSGSEIDQQTYLKVENGRVTDLDWNGYIRKITRMKAAPAFDALDLSSPENEEFGDEKIDGRHFTEYSHAHSKAGTPLMAEDSILKMMNPTAFIIDGSSDVCRHWRIRHGAFDRDTSLAIPVILGTLLMNRGYDVDLALPWGMPHSGDYDLDNLFAWIDSICRE